MEDTFGAFLVSCSVGGEDEEVVHIDDEPSFSDHVSKGVVHESLESGGRVSEAKEHNGWFEEAFMSDEGGFPLVSVFDADVIVAPSNVEFGEDFGIPEFIDEVGDQGKGVSITNGMLVEVPVILAGAKSSVFLLYEEEGGGLGGVGRADFSGVKIFIEKFFGGKAFVGGEGVEFSNFRGKGVGEVDFVVVGSRGGNMVCCFLGEYRGKLRVLGGKDGLWFSSFCGSGEFGGDG